MPSEEPVMPIEDAAEAVASNVETIAPSIPRSFSYDTAIPNMRTKTGLLEYIKTAIELETDLATQERIVAECRAEILERKPILKLHPIPNKPQEIDPNPNGEGCAIGLIGVLFGLMCLGAGIMCLEISPIILILFLLLAFWMLWLGYQGISSIEKTKRHNKEQYDSYERQMGETTKRNKKIQQEYDQAVLECDTSCRAIEEEARPHIDETQSILSRLYSMGVIYPKYCNLPALTSIYEYFLTGRCEELIGPHGAYNLYEDELRKDTVISQLNTVIENLEQIRQNQYMLYEQVCAIQQNTAAIRSELAQIKGYTIQIAELAKLNAYYAARTEANTRITMYYHL